MNPSYPPRLATILLEHFGPESNKEALAGDLLESFRQGRSSAWYWRQVLSAIPWRRHRVCFYLMFLYGWSQASFEASIGSGRWFLALVSITAFGCLSIYLPRFFSSRQRGWMALLIILGGNVLVLLSSVQTIYTASPILFRCPWSVLVLGLLFRRKPTPFRMSLREILRGDRTKEQQRFIRSLQSSAASETNPELIHTYRLAIQALRDEDPSPPGAA